MNTRISVKSVYWTLQNNNIALYGSTRALKNTLWGNVLNSTIDGLLGPCRPFSRPSNNKLPLQNSTGIKKFRKKVCFEEKKLVDIVAGENLNLSMLVMEVGATF